MKSRRPARRSRSLRSRSLWGRIAGYGGTLLLVTAAVLVLLRPLMDDGKDGAAGAGGSAGPSAPAQGGQAGVPGGSGLPATPTNPVPQQNRSGRPYPGGQDGGGSDGGPQIPAQNGSDALSWCPAGTASYRATATGVDVAITVSSSGAIRAELVLQGRAPKSQQTTVLGGKPHTFHFTGVSPRLVERVKVTTVSVGVSMQSCYARAAT